MKRALSLILAIILVCGLAAGCNGNNDTTAPQTEASSVATEPTGTESTEPTVPEGPDLNLFEAGKSEYVIVRGRSATETEIYAASELQKYLKKITGVNLSIVKDTTDPVEKEIVVGKTNREAKENFDRAKLGEDGFDICTSEEKIFLVGGGNRGTIYSVYTFLEDYLGCRFFTESIEKIPQTDTIVLKQIGTDEQIPQFIYRSQSIANALSEDYSVKRKINTGTWGRSLSSKVGGDVTYAQGVGGHTFVSFVDPNKYFASHPEYFSMDASGNRVSNTQLCLTNPDVLKLCVEGMLEWMRTDQDATVISLSQNDINGACLCENCKKVYEEEGGAYSGGLLRFVNAAAAEFAKYYPNVKVMTYAYNYTRSAPTKTKPADNVIIEFCTMGTCFSHAEEDQTCSPSTSASYLDGHYNTFSEDMNAWSKICNNNLFIYDYSNNFQFEPMMFPDLTHVYKNYNYYARSGCMGIEMECTHAGRNMEFQDLRAYLESKLNWNPYMSEEEYYRHMDEFLEYVYGPGAPYLREYIELACAEAEKVHTHLSSGPFEIYPTTSYTKHETTDLPSTLTVAMVKDYKNTNWMDYWNWNFDVKENTVTKKGKVLFNQAYAAAETDEQRTHIKTVYTQVEFLKSFYYYEKISSGGVNSMIKEFIKAHPGDFTDEEAKKLPKDINVFAESMAWDYYAAYNETLCEYMVSMGIAQIYGGGSLNGWQGFDFTVLPVLWPTT